MWTKVFNVSTNSNFKVEVVSVCKPTICLHFALPRFLKYDVLSEHPTTITFATLLNENEVEFMFKGVAIDKSGTHAGVNARASVLFML